MGGSNKARPERTVTLGRYPRDLRRALLTAMDSTSAAEVFPGLYRAILDGVAALEADGQREEARRVRQAATAAYSGSWGDAGRRRLELLLVRIDRALAVRNDPPATGRDRATGAKAPRGLGALLRRLPTAR
jgi:hypothetical protein